jgi:hypothetical protein
LNGSVTLGLIQAVSARLVKGAEGVGDEARDVVFATQGVVLEDLTSIVSMRSSPLLIRQAPNLVLCVASATANNTELGIQAF